MSEEESTTDDMSEFQRALDGDELTDAERRVLRTAVMHYLTFNSQTFERLKENYTGEYMDRMVRAFVTHGELLRTAARKLDLGLPPQKLDG